MTRRPVAFRTPSERIHTGVSISSVLRSFLFRRGFMPRRQVWVPFFQIRVHSIGSLPLSRFVGFDLCRASSGSGHRIDSSPVFRVGRFGMQRGTIKKIVADKGFGFIAGQERGKDLFFHVSAVQETTFDALMEGQAIEYEEEQGPKGARASLVRPA